MVIADESHYLKSEKAKRTKNCLPLLQVSLSLQPTAYSWWAHRCESECAYRAGCRMHGEPFC